MEYRQLLPTEIQTMEHGGCSCDDWQQIQVAAEGFVSKRVRDTRFEGKCFLGANDGYIDTEDGLRMPCGIYSAMISNCRLAKDIRISKISGYIHNYDIGARCRIEGIHLLSAVQDAMAGQGTVVTVLNETGGREVIITDKLTAQTAYLMTFYRHDQELQKALWEQSLTYAASTTSAYGTIGQSVSILGGGSLRNVRIGDYATLEGMTIIEDATICSTAETPSYVGPDVVARHFVMTEGAKVSDGAQIDRCFIGQACSIGHLFSAHDSLFFANCALENGESCAVFAGPFTVSMHKSSLLIAGFFSFLNAGSGSNQSNHLYKLGPIHQGVVERGSKTTSDSYVLWPAHIGPFTLVMGRHVHHCDSSDFPFSYLIEDGGKTFLVPGANLRSVGTIRDARKWPQRDKRNGKRNDAINFNLLSPFTVGKMIAGYHKLQNLKALSGGSDSAHVYAYRDMYIRASALDKGLQYYRLGITKFLGNSIITRINGHSCNSDEELIQALHPEHIDQQIASTWIDLAGLIAPRSKVEGIMQQIKAEGICLEEINVRFGMLHAGYYELEWQWTYPQLLEWYGLSAHELTKEKVSEIICEWMGAVVRLDEMLYEDARKEFNMNTRVGFGVDNVDMRDDDYCSVRGSFESNPFVAEVLEHMDRKRNLGQEILNRLSRDQPS